MKAVVGNTTFQAGLETDTDLPRTILILACLTVTAICSISLDLPRFRLQKYESSFLLHVPMDSISLRRFAALDSGHTTSGCVFWTIYQINFMNYRSCLSSITTTDLLITGDFHLSEFDWTTNHPKKSSEHHHLLSYNSRQFLVSNG